MPHSYRRPIILLRILQHLIYISTQVVLGLLALLSWKQGLSFAFEMVSVLFRSYVDFLDRPWHHLFITIVIRLKQLVQLNLSRCPRGLSCRLHFLPNFIILRLQIVAVGNVAGVANEEWVFYSRHHHRWTHCLTGSEFLRIQERRLDLLRLGYEGLNGMVRLDLDVAL